MYQRKLYQPCLGLLAIAMLLGSAANAQVLDQNFDTVTGSGGGIFFVGPGFMQTDNFDNGITGENAFAGTGGNASFTGVSAAGLPTGGLLGTGAGQISIGGVIFDLINQDFDTVTGTGSATFLVGGGGPNTFGFTPGWDLGIEGEQAFAGTFGGAVLDGSVTARGVVDTDSYGQIVVEDVDPNGGNFYAGIQFEVGSLPGSAALANAGFEGPASGWASFSNAFEFPVPIEIAPLTGAGAAKMFGAFSGPSGLYQDIPTEEGQTFTFSAYAFSPSFDGIGGTLNQAQLRIEWRDASDAVISFDSVVVLDPNSADPNIMDSFDPNFTEDAWFRGELIATAPADAVVGRCLLWFEQPFSEGGAVWWDDAGLEVSGPGTIDLSAIELNANVQGVANGPAGETLSTVQLRIEDSDGDRLLAEITANGSWQPIGGPLGGGLSPFTEADSSGNAASGVFNPNSSFFRIVVAFGDNHGWGTGGTLNVDDIALSNDDSAGSFWYAGIFFDNLDIPIVDPNTPSFLDPNNLVLLADVKGSKAEPYVVRVEGIRLVDSALNENFNSVLGDCGDGDPNSCLILDVFNGETDGFSANPDSGLTGISAFAGIGGTIFSNSTSGVTVEGVVGGGPLSDGSIRITASSLEPDFDGSWYAGIFADNQGLASTDLSQVELTADLKGDTVFLGGFGDMLLRLEDANGDRLQFGVRANGTWQSVGGTLDGATELPAADGLGDGVFNLDDPTYTVVVAFEQPVEDANTPVTWIRGGIVEVDNLYLTPATTTSEIGRFEFAETGNTDFQTTGGFLTAADVKTLETTTGGGGLVVIDFEDGVPNGLQPMNGGAWDDGLIGEFAFSGGSGLASADIEVCPSCGIGGSQAAHVVIDQSSSAWWSGFFFEAVPMDLSAGDGDNLAALSSVILQADVNALGSALPYGVVELRIEDAETDSIYYWLTTDGTQQVAGGPLSSGFARGFADPGRTNGAFDYNQSTYNITVAITNYTTPTWGGLIDVVVDNISYSSVPEVLEVPSSFTVAAAYADEISNWGTDGDLTLDNVLLAVVPNCVADQSLDMRDLARAQVCAKDACRCVDVNGNAAGIGNVADAFDVPSVLVLP